MESNTFSVHTKDGVRYYNYILMNIELGPIVRATKVIKLMFSFMNILYNKVKSYILLHCSVNHQLVGMRNVLPSWSMSAAMNLKPLEL